MVLNDLNKGLGIKFNEQHIHKHECIDDHVGVATSRKFLSKLLHDFRHEIILCTIAFDKHACLDSVSHGRTTTHMNHSCSSNFYVQKKGGT